MLPRGGDWSPTGRKEQAFYPFLNSGNKKPYCRCLIDLFLLSHCLGSIVHKEDGKVPFPYYYNLNETKLSI